MNKKAVFFFLFFIGSGVSSEDPMVDASRLSVEVSNIVDQIFTFSLDTDRGRLIGYFKKIQTNTVGNVLFKKLLTLFLAYKEKYKDLKSTPKISVFKAETSEFTPPSNSPPVSDQEEEKDPEIVAIRDQINRIKKGSYEWFALQEEMLKLKNEKRRSPAPVSSSDKKGVTSNVKKDLVLKINPDDSVKIACVVNADWGEKGHEVILVGSCLPDVDAMIVHELIHMKHYLEEDLGEANKAVVADMSYPDLALIPISQARELRGHRNSLLRSPCLANLPEIRGLLVRNLHGLNLKSEERFAARIRMGSQN